MPKPSTLRKNAGVALALNQFLQVVQVGDAHIEVAVSGENDAVDAALDVMIRRHAIGQLDAGAAGRGAAGGESVQGIQDRILLVGRRGVQYQAGGAGVGDDGHAIVPVQLLDHHLKPFLEQRQLVGAAHRSGDIQQEDQIGRFILAFVGPAALQADTQQFVSRIPRTYMHRHGGRKRGAVGRCAVVVVKIVDHLLDAHGIGRRALSIAQKAPDIGVRRRIHINREGR